MKNKRKLSKEEILRNIASGKYVLGGDTSVTTEAPAIPAGAGYDVSATDAGLLDNVGSKSRTTANQAAGGAAYAAAGLGAVNNIAGQYTNGEALPENEGLNTATSAAQAIPIAGQFVALGTAGSDSIDMGAQELRAQGKDDAATAVEGISGIVSPSSAFSKNAAAYDAGYYGEKGSAEAVGAGVGGMIANILFPGSGSAIASHAESKQPGPPMVVPQTEIVSSGDGSFDGPVANPVRDQQFYGKFGGQMEGQQKLGGLTHYDGLPHELGGIKLKPGVEVEGGETSHKDFVYSDAITNPMTGETYAKTSKRLEKQYKDKSDPRVLKDLDEVLERLKSTQENQKKIEFAGANPYKKRFGGAMKKYQNGGPLTSQQFQDMFNPTAEQIGDYEAALESDVYLTRTGEVANDAGTYLYNNFNTGRLPQAAPTNTPSDATGGLPPGQAIIPFTAMPDQNAVEFKGGQSLTNFEASMDPTKSVADYPYGSAPLDSPEAQAKDPNNFGGYGDLAMLGTNAIASNIGNFVGLSKLKDGYDTVEAETITPQKQNITQLLENIKAGVNTARYNNRVAGRGSVGAQKAILAEGLKARGQSIERLENSYMGAQLQADQFNAQSKMRAADLTAQNKGAFDTREQQLYDSLGANISGSIADFGQYRENQEMRGLLNEYFPDWEYSSKDKKWKRRGSK